MNNGFFGNLFDLNGDGKLDSFEKAADFAAFVSIVENDDETDSDYEENESDDADDD